MHVQTELDSHDDSIGDGSNCCIMHCINSECNFYPYLHECEPIKNVPIVQATTEFT